MLSDQSILVAVDGLSFAQLDGEAIVLDVHSGRYFGLNQMGTHIMELMKQPMRVEQIKRVLLEEFEVELATVEEEVMAFLEKMTHHRLIRIQNGVLSGTESTQ